MWIQYIIWVIVVPIACFFLLVWSSLSRELLWTLFQTNHWFISLKSQTKSVILKPHLRKMDSHVKKVWKIKLLSNWDHAWAFWWGTCKGNFLAKTSLIRLDETHHTYYFFTESEFTGLGQSSPSILVNNGAPLENAFFTTYGPS